MPDGFADDRRGSVRESEATTECQVSHWPNLILCTILFVNYIRIYDSNLEQPKENFPPQLDRPMKETIIADKLI